MQAPAFWWRERPGLKACLLAPLGFVYGRATARRMAKVGSRVDVPVICVGNLVAGGAGKTPTALAIARSLKQAGTPPVFVTRGYGGRLKGPVLVEPDMLAADVGDEPLLLARLAPTIVARDRLAGAELAARAGAGVVILDDGLQNPSLVKALSVAVVDGATGIGNGLCVPAGPMRAPLAAQLPFVDMVVLVGEGAAGEAVAARAAAVGKPVHRARLVADPEAAERLRGRRVLAFAGIGYPAKFFRSLEELGAKVVERQTFPDHHSYKPGEISRLLELAEKKGLSLVTTEKDLARLAGVPAMAEMVSRIETLPVSLRFAAQAEVERTLMGAMVSFYRP